MASDLFTVGRTLAVLLTEISGFTKEHRFTLPPPRKSRCLREQESLYRFLLKATAEKPDDRFESADEMADQLLGVLREVVAVETGAPQPGSQRVFRRGHAGARGRARTMSRCGRIIVILPHALAGCRGSREFMVVNAAMRPKRRSGWRRCKQAVEHSPKSRGSASCGWPMR